MSNVVEIDVDLFGRIHVGLATCIVHVSFLIVFGPVPEVHGTGGGGAGWEHGDRHVQWVRFLEDPFRCLNVAAK